MVVHTSRPKPRAWLAAIAALTLALPLVAISPAGAQSDCGEISFGFEGTRLLNDGISNTAGPFPADIPAGTYTVTLIGHDSHDTQEAGPSQTGEQFRVVLDTGYTSALSIDIPDDANTSTTVLSTCLLYTSPSPRDGLLSRMPSSA